MITTTYNYSSASGFVFDSSKIGFSGGNAVLLLNNNPGQTFGPSISAATHGPNVSYNGGALSQISQQPASNTVYFAWDSFLASNYGLSVTPTAFNGASIVGGTLDLTGSTNKWIQYSGSVTPVQIGTIAFTYVPNYSGTPSAEQSMFLAFGSNGNASGLYIYHNNDGNLHLTVKNSAGGVILAGISSAWAPVAGTPYVICAQIDVTNGATKLFVNGVQFGSTQTATGTRTAGVTVNTGKDTDGVTGNANFKISGLAIYNTIVPPPATPLSDTAYLSDTAVLPLFTYSGAGSVTAYTGFATTDANGVVYTLNGKYWNGTAWVSSSGAYAQANSASVINANIASFPLSNTLQVNAIYQAQNVQGSLTAVTVTYAGQTYPVSNPTIAPNSPLTADQLSAFTSVFTASGSDTVHFYLLINSTPYWWNGTAWVVSDGSFAQSNDAATIQTQSGSLPISLGVFLTPYALLHSATGATTPVLTSLTLTYDFFGEEPAGPNVCTIFGYIVDEQKNIIPNAKVTITNPTSFFNQGLLQAQGAITVQTDSIGYFSITLAETTTVNKQLTWTVAYPTGGGRPPVSQAFSIGKALIPNSPEANFSSLTFTP